MTKELALPSLEIHNFRGLRELKIERLGRANLLVGKNNVGKSSVLEAFAEFDERDLKIAIEGGIEVR